MIKLIEVKKVYKLKNRKELSILNGINLELNDAEFVAIIGRSGSGKTTLLNIISGFEQMDSGNYFYNNKDIRNYSNNDWYLFQNKQIGFIFQHFNLIPHLTVLENVMMKLLLGGESKESSKHITLDILSKVGILDLKDKKPGYLSGGEQQKVAIARAIVSDPDIILADEPTGQLDNKNAIEIMNLIKEVGKNKLVIMVTHMNDVETFATRIIKINDGAIINDRVILPSNVKNKIPEKQNYKVKYKDLLSISFINLRRRLLSSISLICIISIILGIIISSIILNKRSVQDTIYRSMGTNTPIYFINLSKENNEAFTKDEINILKKLNDIKSVIPIYTHVLSVDNEYNLTSKINFEVLPDSISQFYLEDALVYGEYPQKKHEIIIDIESTFNLFNISKNGYTDYLLGDISDQYVWNEVNGKELIIEEYDTVVKVVGLVNNSVWKYGETDIFIDKELLPHFTKIEESKQINIYLNKIDPLSRDKLKDDIILLNQSYLLNTELEKMVTNTFEEFEKIITITNIILLIFILFTSIFVLMILNNFTVNRTREIGIYKSLGVNNKSIYLIFVFETIIIILLASPICYVIATLISNFFFKITKKLFSTSNLNVVSDFILPDFHAYIMIVIVCIIIMSLFCMLFLRKVLRKSIINLLKTFN